MSTPASANSDQELTRSLTSLAIAAWSIEGGQLRLHSPRETPETIARWLASECIRAHAGVVLSSSCPHGPTGRHTVAPGLWMVRATHGTSNAWVLLLGDRSRTSDSPETGLDQASWKWVRARCWPDGESASRAEGLARSLLADAESRREDEAAISGFSRELMLTYETVHLLYRMGRSMGTLTDPEGFIARGCEEIREVMGFSWVAARMGGCSDVVPQLRDRFVHSGPQESASTARESTESLLPSLTGDGWRLVGDQANQSLADVVAHPIRRGPKTIGALVAQCTPEHPISSVETQLLDATADLMGVFLDNAGLYRDQRDLFMGTLRSLTAAVDAKDRYTCGHSERVAMLGSQLARAIGMSDAQCERVRISGLLHDVGKIGVPEAVLTKPGRLTDEEFNLIKLHPGIGDRIIRDIHLLDDVRPGVIAHHERWDGKGYPKGLSGTAIPLYGRMLAIADTFDAMSSTRAYRAALPRDKTLAEILKCAGTQFDPDLAPVFVRMDFSAYDEAVSRHAVEYGTSLLALSA